MDSIDQLFEMGQSRRGDLRAIWEMAVSEERNRLAREIHDSLVQAFAGILLHTEALGVSLVADNPRSKRAYLQIQKLARTGLDEARRSVKALRPKALEGSTLSEALQQAVEQLSEANLFGCFSQRGAALKLSGEVQAALFRIAQEALTNIRKHARATSVWISLEFKSRQVVLTIQDDGIGLAAANPAKCERGFGLATMRERAQRIGGELEIGSPVIGGSMICVRVPLAENGENVNYVKPYETVKN